MAPSINPRSSRTRTCRKQPAGRSPAQQQKKKLSKTKSKYTDEVTKDLSFSNSSSTSFDFDHDHGSSSPCSTPKAERFKIPEIATCPPAPKKRRVLPSCSPLQRHPIAFFAPPDLELFFFFALNNISA